jgi:Ni,Fe-hydrogenase III small subunit
VIKIVLDALAAGRATEPLAGPSEGYLDAAIGRYELADPAQLAAAAAICPTQAISSEAIDDGRCVFCGLCAEGERPAFRNVRVEPAIGRRREDLRRRHALPVVADLPPADDGARVREEGQRLSDTVRRRLGRSLHVRHLDAGGCNGCEWELNQLGAPRYDVQRLGVDFVASPRHADLLLVTGVVTANLELALVRTLDAMPRPRLVVAMGACAVSGGIFGTSYASRGGADRLVAVDAYIAGCPPRPWAVMRALRMVLE